MTAVCALVFVQVGGMCWRSGCRRYATLALRARAPRQAHVSLLSIERLLHFYIEPFEKKSIYSNTQNCQNFENDDITCACLIQVDIIRAIQQSDSPI